MLWYHRYLTLVDKDLNDAAESEYDDSMPCDVQSRSEALLGELGPSYMSNEKKGADGSLSTNIINVNMAGDDDENSGVAQWPAY